MEHTENLRKDFIAYDYKEVTVKPEYASMILDGYENFGWQSDEHFSEIQSRQEQSKTRIRMRRDWKIVNKAELTRLQRKFESCVGQLLSLEHSKTSAATVGSLVIGVIGTAFMAGSVFAMTAQTPYIVLSVILAIPGFIGWIVPYFFYKGIVRRQEEKTIPLVEAKLDEIYEICKNENRLLN